MLSTQDIFKNPKFSIAEATGGEFDAVALKILLTKKDDVCPGRNEALWFQAGLTTALNRPELVKRLCVSSYPDTGMYIA